MNLSERLVSGEPRKPAMRKQDGERWQQFTWEVTCLYTTSDTTGHSTNGSPDRSVESESEEMWEGGYG